MAGGFEYVYPYNRNNIFVAAEEGFYHINYEQYRTVKENITILFSNVKISNKKDSTIFGGFANNTSSNELINKSIPEIKYRWNSVHFEYSSSLYGKQSSIEYSYYLEGFDKNWSAMVKKNRKRISYLFTRNLYI